MWMQPAHTRALSKQIPELRSTVPWKPEDNHVCYLNCQVCGHFFYDSWKPTHILRSQRRKRWAYYREKVPSDGRCKRKSRESMKERELFGCGGTCGTLDTQTPKRSVSYSILAAYNKSSLGNFWKNILYIDVGIYICIYIFKVYIHVNYFLRDWEDTGTSMSRDTWWSFVCVLYLEQVLPLLQHASCAMPAGRARAVLSESRALWSLLCTQGQWFHSGAWTAPDLIASCNSSFNNVILMIRIPSMKLWRIHTSHAYLPVYLKGRDTQIERETWRGKVRNRSSIHWCTPGLITTAMSEPGWCKKSRTWAAVAQVLALSSIYLHRNIDGTERKAAQLHFKRAVLYEMLVLQLVIQPDISQCWPQCFFLIQVSVSCTYALIHVQKSSYL